MNLNLYQQARERRSEFRTRQELERTLQWIDGLGYGAYRELYGGWRFDRFELFINHVPPDHHGPPAHWLIWSDPDVLGWSREFWDCRWKRVAAADFFLRAFRSALGGQPPGSRGSGIGGLMTTDAPGQAIEERNACFFDGDVLELKLLSGMPSAGMIILADEFRAMLRILELSVDEAWVARAARIEALRKHHRTVEVQDRLRAELHRRGLVAFVAEGALLPRRGGNSDLPSPLGRAEPFESPPSLRVDMDLGELGRFTGLGVPRGVTVITGGSYHGKSTLLSAIEEGTKNHIAGDGREAVVAISRTFRTEAEEGRRVAQVDLSPFLHHLPSHVDIRDFSTEFASGSTSQAAAIIEAIDAGAQLLLIDEDRAATNLMFADEGMRALMEADDCTVTSFLERARELYETCGISSLIVAGASSRYFSIADTVLKMENYRCRDVSDPARAISARYHPVMPKPPSPLRFSSRKLLPLEKDLYRGRRFVECSAVSRGVLKLESHEVDLGRLPGVWTREKLVAAGLAVAFLLQSLGQSPAAVSPMLDLLERRLDEEGLNLLDPFRQHFLVRPDRFQVAAALNRFPGIRFQNEPQMDAAIP